MGNSRWIGWLAVVFCLNGVLCRADDAARQETLDQMLRIFPESKPWQQWLDETGELPPDFDALPSIPFLPDPLITQDGDRVTTPQEWKQRRAELLPLIQHYITGTTPPPPGNVRVARRDTRTEGALTFHDLTLEFGPEHRASLDMQLIVPPGDGPFPVFLTQDNHYRWALVAAARGYIGCVYAGADSRDDTAGFIPIWPEHDWTKLTRRAWAGSRCLDYLLTLPTVNKDQICLTGHSRNGKLSIIGGCLDERITAIISSSSGAGGACPYRLFSEAQFGEGIELLTRVFPDWMHPRLRFFAGRENKLPIDQHELIACIAPRACLIATALNDNVESLWAIDHTYRAAQPVYTLLDAPDALLLQYRWGNHETYPETIEDFVDWLDGVFGRGPALETQPCLYPTYDDWLVKSGEVVKPEDFPTRSTDELLAASNGQAITEESDWDRKTGSIRAHIAWAMGDAPPVGARSAGGYGREKTHRAAMMGRDDVSGAIDKLGLNFGNYIPGDLYYPRGADSVDERIPVIIWLHPLDNARGYVPSYRRGRPPHLRLVDAGFAVFAFDQIGCGHRLEEVIRFYDRYPHWSLLGKMVSDVRASLAAVDTVPFIDTNRVLVVGYDLGAVVGLHAAALDDRITGVVSVAGLTPMRNRPQDAGIGGIARWTTWMPLAPRLGAFIGNESRIPYDYQELLALIAPRPVMVVAPTLDCSADLKAIRSCVEQAAKIYDLRNAHDRLHLVEFEDYNRFSTELQDEIIPHIQAMMGL